MHDYYDNFTAWLQAHPVTTGGGLALALTALRIGLSETSRSFGFVCLEGLSCGLLSMALSYAAIGLLGVDSSVGVLIGATAGFIGVDRLKLALIKILDLWLTRAAPGSGGKAGENRNGNDEQ